MLLTDPNDIVLTGENSFIRLREGDDGDATDRISHWRILWSPAGAGHALFMDGRLVDGTPRVYTDNFGLARWLQRTIEHFLHAPFGDESIPAIDADFERTGDSLTTVVERVVSAEDEVIAAWWDLLPGFVLTVPPGHQGRPLGVYSTFLPAQTAQLTLNGVRAEGDPWRADRDGRHCTTACLAWSETWTQPRS